MFGAAALFASACTMEIVDPQSQPVGEPSSIVFTAGVETRTTLVPDTDGDETVNHQIHWVSGDKINIDGVEFSTTDDGAKAYFTTESAFVEDNDYVAVYPASAGKSFDEITVPWEQSAVKGNFNSAAVVSVAKTTTTSLDFKNLTSILKFQVPAAASKVTISADQPLAGTVKVDWNNGEPTWVAVDGKTSNEVTVTGSLTAGVDYYVAVLPGEKANFKVSIDGNVSRTASTVNAKRSMVMNMGILPEPIGEGIFINPSGEYEISTESGLFKFADMVKAGNTFKGKTVKLTDDIEMTQNWTPIGLGGQNDPTFMGTFDGQGYTISNLTVEAAEYPAFFGRKYCGDVLNVKFDKATVTGNHYGAVIVGWTDDTNYTWDGAKEKFKIHGCEVTNSTVTLSPEYTGTKWDNGDKAGAIVGYAYSITVSNNKVSNTTITGYRDLGGVVGAAIASGECFTTVSGNEVGENVSIVVDNSHNYKNFTEAASYNLGSVWGRSDDNGGKENELQVNPAGATLVPPVSRNLKFAEATATAVVGEDCKEPVLNGTTDGVTYSSSDETVATVDANGNVTAKKAGTVTITATAPDTKTLFAGSASYTLTVKEILYLVPNSNWTQDNARFAAYFFGPNDIKEWVSMADSNEDGIYEVEIPAGGYTTVIFCRMNPANNVNDWGSNGSHKWNQTGDMVLGNDKYCVIAPLAWDKESVWSSTKSFFKDNEIALYLTHRDWANDGAKFKVEFINGTNKKQVDLVAPAGCTYCFKAATPSGSWTSVKFYRCSPSDGSTWNNTNSVSLSGKNYFEVTGWGTSDIKSYNY